MIFSIIALFSFFMAGVCKSTADTLADSYDASIFYYLRKSFWDKRISWMNKYKYGDRKLGPRFFGSTTFLVWLTDGWHFSNFYEHFFIYIGIVFLPEKYQVVHIKDLHYYFEWSNLIPLFVIIYGMWGVGFVLTHDWLFKKTTWK